MRILFFTTGMSAGGAERVIANLANKFAETNHTSIIAMLKGEESAYSLNTEVQLHTARLEPGPQNAPASIRFLEKVVNQTSPDVIMSFSSKSDIIALLAKKLKKIHIPVIVSDRADPQNRSKLIQRACLFLYPSADALVCQSEQVADFYRQRIRLQREAVIPNPLNEESFSSVPVSFDEREQHMFSVGRLSHQKNHEIAIRAFKQLRKHFPGLSMSIYGEGPLEHELRSLINELGLGNVVTLAGVIPNVIKHEAKAALFLFTSNYEGYPNALLEAASSGIPVVTTDFSPGTASKIITNGVNGIITKPGSVEELVVAAKSVLMGALKDEPLNKAAMKVRQAHQIDVIATQWLEIVKQVV